MAQPHLSVTTLYGVGDAMGERLARLGISSLHDLIWYFPRQYEDRSDITPIAEVSADSSVTISGGIAQIRARRTFGRRKMHIVEALIRDDSGDIKAVWFNQPYLSEQLKNGDHLLFSGTAKQTPYGLVLQNPVHERSIPGKDTTHTGRIVPNYALTEGITQKQLRSYIKTALRLVLPIDETLPDVVLQDYSLLPINDALQQMHFPESGATCQEARKRFAFEELFITQLHAQQVRQELHTHAAPQLAFDETYIKQFVQQLPFALTNAQRKSAWAILQDMQKPVPMNRLLSGDVGSGKTVVAAIAIASCVRHHMQTVVMVPTEIVAQQHTATLRAIFAAHPTIRIELLTANTRDKQTASQADIVVGTHAVIQDGVRFSRLGLVIVDEQHRFGVRQRQALKEATRSDDSILPHLLSMTATPIPRTLALAQYGDLDLSVIDEMPKGRLPVDTQVVPAEKRRSAYAFIRKHIQAGEQCFVLCPLIEPSDLSGMRSVTAEFEHLRTEVFPDLRIGMLHGKMKPREKDAIMEQMRNNKIDILVSTSVIEVGVDIPNATIMMIEGADRFGLSQLHQFRGRVGRSATQSYCFLFTDSRSQKSLDRLHAIEKTHNGFKLAEIDREMRGSGEVYGTQQSGFSQSLLALQNPELIAQAQLAAKKAIAQNWLTTFPQLQKSFAQFSQRIHLE